MLERLESYTALRSIGVQREKILLNGRPYAMRLVLDQGYWPESFMTAPSDEALRRDVELAKAMGFNGVRKHQKLEDPRYLYWADVLGLPVSTTHVLSSGVAGTMAANGSGLQMATVRNLLMAWVLTLPCAILLSGTLYVIFAQIF